MFLAPVQSTDGTAAANVLTGPGALVSVNLCGGADAATVTVYDNTAASGDVICKLGVAAGASDSFTPTAPLAVGKGIHFAITGTTPQVVIAFY